MVDLEIKRFQKAVTDFTNQTELPLEVKRLVFRDILYQIEQEIGNVIQVQLAEEARIAEEQKNQEVGENGISESIQSDALGGQSEQKNTSQ